MFDLGEWTWWFAKLLETSCMWKVILGTWTNAPAVHAGRAECCVTLKYAPLSSVRHQPRPKEPAATSAKVSFHSGSNSKCVFFFFFP